MNYDPLSASLKGATIGVIAFHVDLVRNLDSGSTLPQVTMTILDATTRCAARTLYHAPVPDSSSVPADRTVPGSATGYESVDPTPWD